MRRFMKVHNGKKQGLPQQLPPEWKGATDEEAAEGGWYPIIEVDENSLPRIDEDFERVIESDYMIFEETKTVEPIYRVEQINVFEGTDYEQSDHRLAAKYFNAPNKDRNVYLRSLARGKVRQVETI